jgi:iron complex outermembrane receptor protein
MGLLLHPPDTAASEHKRQAMTLIFANGARRMLLAALMLLACASRAAAADGTNDSDATGSRIVVNVVATSPLKGPGIDPDKLPVTVDSLTAKDFARLNSLSVTDTLMQRTPGISTSDPQGNDFAMDVRFRGFAASPLQGSPQGLAVYQNGVRLNEAFGDSVNWDLIPKIAIDRADTWTSNPLFGLNALGGAVNIQMKTGFNFAGGDASIQGGSAKLIDGTIEYGWHRDNLGVYLAADGLSEDGWRDHSPSRLARFYGDLGWRDADSELHLAATVASNRFGVVGPTPVELLAVDRDSVFTWPQTTSNDMQMLALNGTRKLSDAWSLQGNLYGRHFKQTHVDGNAGDFEQCSSRSSFPTALCLEDDGFPVPPGGKTPAFRDQFVIVDPTGAPIPFADDDTPYGTVDRTNTDAKTLGGSLQATSDAALAGHQNHFVAGASVDHSRVNFSAGSKLGYIYPSLFVGDNDVLPGSGQIIHTLGNIGLAPVQIRSTTTYYGVYATDTVDLTPQLAATLGARYNEARVNLEDQLGTSTELNGSHTFHRFNPNAGLAYKLSDATTIFGGYSEANRAPTPLELGCSDPQKPCLLEGFLVADPPVQQVVSKTFELGVRGHWNLAGGRTEWQASAFHTNVDNDIISLASAIQGRGFFQNVPATRRQGIDIGLQHRTAKWFAYLNYNYIEATYRFTGDIASPNNPQADDAGNIHVTPGNRIPGIPRQQVKTGADYALSPALTIGGDIAFVDRQYYVGDDANQNPQLPSYTVASVHATYAISRDMDIFGNINNLFDRKYALYGTYFDPGDVANAIPQTLTDPRTQTPAQGISFRVGVRVRF